MTRRTIPVTSNDANICVGCGLCCDGTLFDWAPLRADDDRSGPIFEHGARVGDRDDSFHLPCTSVVDGRCQIYELERPHVCGAFFCDLHRAVESGGVAYEDAARIVEDTIRHRDVVRNGLESALGRPLDTSLAVAFAEFGRLPAEDRAVHQELLIDYAALRLRLTKHFSEKLGFRMGASGSDGS